MRNIPEILLKVPFCKAYSSACKFTAAFLPLTLLTSCSFITSTFDSVVNFYDKDSPVSLTEYNYQTDARPELKIKGFDEYKFKLSADEFYVKRTIALTDGLFDMGKKYRENEDRRERERYLTSLTAN